MKEFQKISRTPYPYDQPYTDTFPGFNHKPVSCMKHGKTTTMICLTDKCEDRLLCQECLINHAHSHIAKVIPLNEFNSQTNQIPFLISKEIIQQRSRVYNLQNTCVVSREKRRAEFQQAIKGLKIIFNEKCKIFEDNGLLKIDEHFNKYSQLVVNQLYSIQSHLETLAPYTSQNQTVESTNINFIVSYQEKMIHEILPSLNAQIDQISQKIMNLDLFINKDELLNNFSRNVEQMFKKSDILSEKNVNEKNEKLEKIWLNKNLQKSNSLVINNLPSISQSLVFNNNRSVTSSHEQSQISLPFDHFFASNPLNKEIEGHSDIVTWICLIDYQRFASCSGDKTIKIWDIDKGKLTGNLLGHTADVWCAVMLTQKNMASCSSDKTIKIWDIADFCCVTTLAGHMDMVKCLAYNQKTQKLYSGGGDKLIKQWNIKAQKCEKNIEIHKWMVKQIMFLKDNNIFVSCSTDKTCKVYDLEKNYCIQGFRGHEADINCLVELLPISNEPIVASGDSQGIIFVWNALQGHRIRQIKAHKGGVNGLAFVLNQNILISVGSDQTIRYWEILNYSLIEAINLNKESIIGHCQYHYSRNVIITAGWNKKINLITFRLKETPLAALKQYLNDGLPQ